MTLVVFCIDDLRGHNVYEFFSIFSNLKVSNCASLGFLKSSDLVISYFVDLWVWNFDDLEVY